MKRFILLLGMVGFAGWVGMFQGHTVLAAEKEDGEQKSPPAAVGHFHTTVTVMGTSDDPRSKVVVFGDLHLKSGESATDVVVVVGDGIVDGTVEKDLVVLAGNLTVNGTVNGNVTVFLGTLELGPEAKIKGNTKLVMGAQHSTGLKKFDVGKTYEFLGKYAFPTLYPYVTEGLMKGRFVVPSVQVSVWVAANLIWLMVLVAAVMKRPTLAGATVLAARPLITLGAGLLAWVLWVLTVLLLGISVMGLVVVPFLLCGLVVVWMLGTASVLMDFGRHIGRVTRLEFFERPLWATSLGAVLFFIMSMVPMLGFLAFGSVSVLAMGAMTLAAMEGLNGRSQSGAAAIPVPPRVMETAVPVVPPILSGMPPADPLPLGSHPPAPVISQTVAVAVAEAIAYIRAGFIRRSMALFLDVILLSIVCGMLGLMENGPGIFFMAIMFYQVALLAWRGTTIGKIILGLKVVRLDGSPLSFGVVFVRTLASVFSVLILFLGYFWALWDDEKQTWHDKIAGTVVVKVPKGISLL